MENPEERRKKNLRLTHKERSSGPKIPISEASLQQKDPEGLSGCRTTHQSDECLCVKENKEVEKSEKRCFLLSLCKAREDRL